MFKKSYIKFDFSLKNEFFFMQISDATHSYLKPVLSATLELNADVQQCIYETLMSPIRQQVSQIGGPEWDNIISNSGGLTEDLPEFGLAPMEYITQVGQYLMMLPQHLEPFVLNENKGLARALAEQGDYYCEMVIIISVSMAPQTLI